MASIEEARCLYSDLGYTWVDVRPELEINEVGKFKNAVSIPLKISKKVRARIRSCRAGHGAMPACRMAHAK